MAKHQLHAASRQGTLMFALAALEARCDVNSRDNQGMTRSSNYYGRGEHVAFTMLEGWCRPRRSGY